MLKLFTNPRGQSIAINPDNVLMVTEEDNGTSIRLVSGTQVVAEPYLEVVALLNETGNSKK